MNDNTQELDEILEDFYDGDIRQSDMGKAKYAILDWHNKQVEEVLDRLEAQWGETIDNTLGKPRRIKFISVDAIRAERNKLKEVK